MIPGWQFLQPPAPFPTADESLSFGWEFLKANFFKIAAIDAFGAFVATVLTATVAAITDDPPWYVAAATWATARVVLAFAAVATLRRALDYWDEANRRSKPRDFSAGIGNAFEVAFKRLAPWIGYNLLVGVAMFIAYLPFRLVWSADISTWPRIGLGLLALVVAIALGVLLAFVPVGAADGPGDAISRSWYIGRSNFGRVFETFFVFAFVTAIPSLAFYAVVRLVDNGWIVLPTYFVFIVGIQSLGLGTIVNMYRSQVTPRGE